MNIGELFVKLTADPSGVNRGVDQATKKFNTLNNTLAKVGGALAAVFTIQRLGAFGADAVRTYVEAERVWNKLAGTLAAAGVEFGSVSGEITRAARALQDATTIGDEDFAGVLQRLVAITGDYGASLREVETVANFAAGANLDLNAAAVLVGKAMVGETGTLSRYGIVVGEAGDAMQVLRDRFKGLAENETKTLGGAVKQLGNEWGDLKEAIGGAIVGGSSAIDTINRITNAVQSMAEWVDRNRGVFDGLRSGIIRFAQDAGRDIKDLTAAWQGLVDIWRDAKAEWRVLTATLAERQSGFVGTGAGGSWDQIARGAEGAQQATEQAASSMEQMTDRAKLLSQAIATLPKFSAPWLDANRQIVALQAQSLSLARAEADQLGAMAQAYRNIAASLNEAVEAGRNLIPARVPDLSVTTSSTIQLATGQTVEVAGLKEAGQEMARVAETTAALDLTLKKVRPPKLDIPVEPGMLSQAFSGLGTVVKDALTASVGPMAVAFEFVRGIFDALGPAIEALLQPLRVMGQLIGVAIVPVLEALRPVLDLVAKAFSYVIQGIGYLIRGIGDLLNKLPGSIGNPLKKFGQNMIDQAEATRRAIDAQELLVKSTKDAARGVSNIPAIFDTALRRRQAMAGGGSSTGGATSGGGVTSPGARPPLVVQLINPPAGMDVAGTVKQVVRGLSDELRKGGASELRAALAL